MSSHLDKTTLQFFICPFSLNLVLLNGNLFTVDLQDYFVLPSKLFFQFSVLYSFEIATTHPTPTTITMIKVLIDRFKKIDVCERKESCL